MNNSIRVGPELDAATLRAIGWEFIEGMFGDVDSCWRRPGHTEGSFCWLPTPTKLSTDPNGHEALRLCGPWLDEHTTTWELVSGRGGYVRVGYTSLDLTVDTSWPIHGTRAFAICRLVLAIAEREGT